MHGYAASLPERHCQYPRHRTADSDCRAGYKTAEDSFHTERQLVTPHQTTALVPMLSVRNGAKAIDFYKTAFGAVELFRVDNESGEVVAQLSVGSAEFWFADESPQHFNFVSRRWLCQDAVDYERSECSFRASCRSRSHCCFTCRRTAWLAGGTSCRPVRTPLGHRQAVGKRPLTCRRFSEPSLARDSRQPSLPPIPERWQETTVAEPMLMCRPRW